MLFQAVCLASCHSDEPVALMGINYRALTWWLDEAIFICFSRIDFRGVRKLMAVLPDTKVRSQGWWHPSAWDWAAGTKEAACLGMHYGLIGVPEGRIWPWRLQRSQFMWMDVTIYLLHASCLLLFLLASSLHCLRKCFPISHCRDFWKPFETGAMRAPVSGIARLAPGKDML